MNLIGLFLTFPLLFSIASYSWSHFYGDEDDFPAGSRVHLLLIIAQGITTTSFFSMWNTTFSKFALFTLFLLQAIGVIYLLLLKGSVPCGCFGSRVKGNLNWKLVLLNFLLAVFPLVPTDRLVISINPIQGLLLELMLFFTSLFIVVGIPEALYAIKGYRNKAKRYYSIILRS